VRRTKDKDFDVGLKTSIERGRQRAGSRILEDGWSKGATQITRSTKPTILACNVDPSPSKGKIAKKGTGGFSLSKRPGNEILPAMGVCGLKNGRS